MLRIKEMREATGLKVKDVAQKVGVPYETYRKWEKGDSNPDWENLCLIADALHCSVDALVGHEPKPDARLQEIVSIYDSLEEQGRELMLDNSRMLKSHFLKKEVPSGVEQTA